jgi:signal transduction histidine kinase
VSDTPSGRGPCRPWDKGGPRRQPPPGTPGSPPWAQAWHHRRRGFLSKILGAKRVRLRFAGFIGSLALLVGGGMAILAFLLTRFFGGDGQTVLLVWLGGCGLALALPLLAAVLGLRALRGVALPLADMLAAIGAVANGDLSVRVPERGPGEIHRLAHSFNRMIDELARTDQQRRNLTADVAHELRTPLHIIQGNLEGILDGVYQPAPEHIEATLEEIRLLTRLVDDLRTLSLAESGQLPLRLGPVDVGELLADVTTSFSGQAEAAGITLRAVTAQPGGTEASPLVVDGDADRLDQVLSNLLANALRHTPPGGSVTLAATAVGDRVSITLNDTGHGIAPDDLPFIFDRFWRGDRARSHTDGVGSGLGLSIASQLVKAHGGEIEVTSELGQGTTFIITLTADSTNQRKSESAKGDSLHR